MARGKAPKIGQKITVTFKGAKVTGRLHALTDTKACIMTRVGNLDKPVWVPVGLILK